MKENWNHLFSEKDPNKAYQILHDKYCEHYNNSLTIKTCTLGRKSPREPWMTNNIIRKMKKRDRLSKLSHRRNDYKQLRNEIVGDCRKAEKEQKNSRKHLRH